MAFDDASGLRNRGSFFALVLVLVPVLAARESERGTEALEDVAVSGTEVVLSERGRKKGKLRGAVEVRLSK